MQSDIKHVWVITAHAESEFLEDCICSILNQTVKSKIIMCTATDNGHIRSLAEKYSIELYIKNGRDIVRDNWNYAYNMADGDWVTLAHQDDIYQPNYVEELNRKVKNIKNASIFFSDYRPFGNYGKGAMRNKKIEKTICFPLRIPLFAKSRFFKCFILALGNAICCPTVSFHKAFLGRDLFAHADKNNINANLDWEMWIYLAKKKNAFVYSPKELLKYRLHENQETATYMENKTRISEDARCFELIWPKFIVRFLMKFYKKAYDIY